MHNFRSFILKFQYLRKTPPSKEAFKHSGDDNLRSTSPTLTLYFEVELSKDKRPGTWQKTELGDISQSPLLFRLRSSLIIAPPIRKAIKDIQLNIVFVSAD